MKRTVREGTRIRTARGIGAIALAILLLPSAGAPETVTDAAVLNEAERVLRGALGAAGDVEIEWTGAARLDGVEGKDLTIRAKPTRPITTYGPVVLSVEFLDGDRVLERRVVSARVRVWRDVVVTDRRLDRHETVDSGDLRLERREIRTVADDVFGAATALEGMRTRRMLGDGVIVKRDDVEPVPLVRRGERVMLTVSYGGITVSAVAKALDDGVSGDVIRVKNERSGRRLYGVVVAEGLVRVDGEARPGGIKG
ncbi:MAG: flagellar basal body P-ring formation chaperone FlgA [Candidatus Eisenbacteria bacterium]